jgi:tRNA A58 N-methylase Trm61
LRRKRERYIFFFEARRPTASELCDCYSSHVPHTICNLRTDSLGLMINLSNLNSNSKALVVEATKGLLLGACMERDPAHITRIEFNKMNSLKNDIENFEHFNHPYHKNRKITLLTQKLILDKSDPVGMMVRKTLIKKFDSVLFCHDLYHPLDLWKSTADFMAPNASFACFSQYLNPLRELEEYLKETNGALRIKVEELWMREQ